MRFQRVPRVCCILICAAALVPRARAQGIIVDRDARHFHVPIARACEIREVVVDARIRDQVADVQVSQTFHNPSSFPIESEYFFPLPEDGAIQNFVLMVDGKELPGRMLRTEEARRIYEDIVRSRRDPALLEYMGRGLFKTSVFPIPPGADRKVTMRYTQLCKREREVVEFAYPFSTQKFTAKPIQRLALNLSIESRDAIKSTYSPTYDARIDRSGDHDLRVSLEQHDVVPTADFRLVYTLAEGSLGATVLSYRPSGSDDGYFLVLASPEVKPPDRKPLPKTVIFVLDRSGSMAGKKIEQAKKALGFVLNNLREGDLFNIVVYDDRVESFKPELQRFDSESRRAADRFVDNIREGGSTNIDAAVKTAMSMIQSDDRPSYVLFLTDGLPTAGETRELSIAEHCHEANSKHARLFAFGVGFDVNARLLDRLSGGNSGTSEYVRPDEDIEAHVARFYSKMTSPVLSDIRIELAGVDVNRTYPRDIPDLFEGGQLVWVGRYRHSNRTRVRLSGKVAGERRECEFPADLAETGRGTTYDFVEKLWAVRRVGFIIDQVDLHGRSTELIDELVALSTKYGILTPYTSFLADEATPLHAGRQNSLRAGESLSELNATTGQSGVAQRDLKQRLAAADRPDASGPRADAFTERERIAGGGMRGMARAPVGGFGGRMGTMGGGMGAGMGGGLGPASGIVVEDARGTKTVVGTVRQIGAKTFYRKGDHWVDSTVTPEQESRATRVVQFSDEFFRLAQSQKAELNQYLAFDEPVTVNLNERTYRFERPSK